MFAIGSLAFTVDSFMKKSKRVNITIGYITFAIGRVLFIFSSYNADINWMGVAVQKKVEVDNLENNSESEQDSEDDDLEKQLREDNTDN